MGQLDSGKIHKVLAGSGVRFPLAEPQLERAALQLMAGRTIPSSTGNE